MKTSSVPQAKGRIERLHQTLQSRLPVALRLAGSSTIEEANRFLNAYIKEYNAPFSLPLNRTKTVYEKQPSNEKIDQILAILSPRKIDGGHGIKYKNKYYLPHTKQGLPVYLKRKTDALVIEAFDGTIYTNVLEELYVLEEVKVRYDKSKEFDAIGKETKPKKKHIPPMSHPWKQASYLRYLETQKHRQSGTYI